MRTLNKQEIMDILIGCTILGTGGGGALKEGIEAVERELAAGKEFKLLDFSEIRDDGYYTNPYLCGTVVPDDQMVELSGQELPVSHLLTAGADTPSCSASCSWVSPRPLRMAWIFCPVVMGTPPSSGYSIQELPVARNHSKVERAQPGVAFSSFLLAPAPGLWSFSAQTSTPRSSLGRW